ncbi:MAG: hypothetical protein HYZ48_01610 [Chlamydiales bacterium]|nr:hypothetical protein [Chlamydiales bacterium]
MSVTSSDLRIPYEIGRFIASQIPHLDDDHRSVPIDFNSPWAEHKGHFQSGPRSSQCQMKQGLVLEVVNGVDCPRSIYTRYGEWKILGSSSGSFEKIFQVLQKTLNLKKIEEMSNEYISRWAIQTWNGQILEEPIFANRDEYLPHKTVNAAYTEFRI